MEKKDLKNMINKMIKDFENFEYISLNNKNNLLLALDDHISKEQIKELENIFFQNNREKTIEILQKIVEGLK